MANWMLMIIWWLSDCYKPVQKTVPPGQTAQLNTCATSQHRRPFRLDKLLSWIRVLQAGTEDSSAWTNCLAEYVCYKPVQKTVPPGQTAQLNTCVTSRYRRQFSLDKLLSWIRVLQAGTEDSSAWINCSAEYVCYKPVQKTVQPGQTA